MSEVKNYLVGFAIAVIIGLALYFFWFTPEVNKAYQRGFLDASSKIDTVFIQGKDSIIYNNTSLVAKTKTTLKSGKDSITMKDINTSSFDSTFVSNEDTIKVHAEIKIYDENNIDWLVNVKHKDYEKSRIDTVKITVPKMVETIVKENNWLITGIAYVAGIVSAVIVFLIPK